MISTMPPSEERPAIDLQKIQHWRKHILWALFGLTLVPAALFVGSYWWPRAKPLHKTIEWIGIILIFVCIFGRTWCSLYIGGRKKRELVTLGPYSLCRNPLYAFTVLGALGIGAQSGSMTLASAVGMATFAVFHTVVKREEAFLAQAFGPALCRASSAVLAALFSVEGRFQYDRQSVSDRANFPRRDSFSACDPCRRVAGGASEAGYASGIASAAVNSRARADRSRHEGSPPASGQVWSQQSGAGRRSPRLALCALALAVELVLVAA